jgi:GDP-L-fucose synthase
LTSKIFYILTILINQWDVLGKSMIAIRKSSLLFLFFLFYVVKGFAVMPLDAKIWVAGHKGLVGSAIVRHLQNEGYFNLILKSHEDLDLCDEAAVKAFYEKEDPEYVFVAAAKVGGIVANNTFPAEFIHTNLMIESNVIHGAYRAKVKKLLFLGSSCIYPRDCPQPIKEDYLLTGPLEPTNECYAVAKIAGLKLCQAYTKQYKKRFISLMPTNLYGPKDSFDLQTSHVIPALIRKFVEAKESNCPEVVVWGSGKPFREFLFVDDLAEACVWAMNHYEENRWLNVGTGNDISIGNLAQMISDLVGYTGQIIFDSSKPDGTPKKLLDVSKINGLGWKAKTSLKDGLSQTIEWYKRSRCFD